MFFEKNPLPVWIFDSETLKFLAVNEAAVRRYGYSTDEFLGMTASDIRPPEDVPLFNEAVSSVNGTEFRPMGEWRHRLRSGEIIEVEIHAAEFLFNGRKSTLSIIHEITERKRIESSLRQALEKHEAIFEGSRDAIFISDIESRFISVNDAACELTGYTRDELMRMKIPDLHDDVDLRAFNRFHDRIMAGEPALTEAFLLRRDGRKTPVEFNNRRIVLSGRQYMHTTARDISDRKEAEATIRVSEAKYRDLIESMPVGHYVSTTGGKFVEVNPAFCEMLGYSMEEMLEMNIPDKLYFARSERQGESRYSGFSPVTEVYRLRAKDGSEVWFADYARYIRDDGGRIVFHEGLCQNISEQKRTKEALELSESRYRTVIENSSDAIVFLDADGKLLEILNATAFQRITGYAVQERIGKSGFDLVHPDDEKMVRKKLASAITTGDPEKAEFRGMHKDGSWRWIEATARNMLADPLINALVVKIRDVNQRKSAELMVAESEERYRLLVDNSPDAIVVITDGKFAYVNPATLKTMGAGSVDDLVGKSIYDFIDGEFADTVALRIREMYGVRKPARPEELKVHRLDGSVIEVDVRSTPVKYLGKPSVQSVIRNVTTRKRVEEQLLLQGVALNTAANGIVITDTTGKIVWVNRAFETLTGFLLDEATGRNLRELVKSGKHDRSFYEDMWGTILSGKIWHGELINRRKDGSLYNEDMTIAPVLNEEGVMTHFVAVKQDITERKSLEEQLLQSQKLESIGQLAGGVAHDYNNILGVIIGYAELLKMKLKDDFDSRKSVEYILAASTRGADLTRQLLAFARKEMISPRVVDLNSSIESIQKMIQRIIGENIKLEFVPGRSLWNVKFDPSQLDQVLVNMAANSRDAIKGVGTIRIETENVLIDEEYSKARPGLVAGELVRLTFSDTGHGMDAETLKRIFEPFFTTKQKGQGTGLGLSTVYGIIKQNNGNIYVTSKAGLGTTFEIFVPRCKESLNGEAEQPSDISLTGAGTVLVVEDQPDMLELVRVTLEKYGYRVLTALSPDEALLLCEAFSDTIHLLLTDVIMPSMSGKELSGKVMAMYPQIKTLFMSGYTANELDPAGVLGEDVEFIQKPFAPSELARKVGSVLAS